MSVVASPSRAPALGSLRPQATTRVTDAVHLAVGLYILTSCVAPARFGNALVAVLVVALAFALSRGAVIPTAAAGWALALGSLGVFGVVNGAIRGHEHALQPVTIYVIEPLLLGILFPTIYSTLADRRRLLTTLDVALIGVAFVSFLVFLQEVLGTQFPIGPLTGAGYDVVDLSAGTIRTNYQGLNALIFLAPYGLVRALSGRGQLTFLRRGLLGLSAVLGTFLAGRSVLYVVPPLAICGAFALAALLRRGERRRRPQQLRRRRVGRILGALVLIVLALVLALRALQVSPSTLLESIKQEATLTDDSSARSEQSPRLLEKWLDSPVIGHGTATTVEGFVRNADAPWQFELSYHVVLVTFGAVGALLLAAWLAWMLWWLRPVPGADRLEGIAVTAGLIGAVLASASNPYLFKLDGIWMTFVPFAIAVARRGRIRGDLPAEAS